MKRPRRQQGIQSIEVGARVLSALANAPGPLMLKDLAAAAAMAPAKAHRYLVSFARMGLVRQDTDTGHYDLGAFALRLGLAALSRVDALAVAAPILRELGQRIDQTVALAVWANHGATIVRWIGADAPVSASLRVGSVMPLTRSATGGAFLAFLPPRFTAGFLKKELADNLRRDAEPKTRAQVDAWVAEIRADGVARTSQFIPGISGAAVPVKDHSGALALVLVALGYSGTFDLDLHGSIVPQMLAARRRVEAGLGGK